VVTCKEKLSDFYGLASLLNSQALLHERR